MNTLCRVRFPPSTQITAISSDTSHEIRFGGQDHTARTQPFLVCLVAKPQNWMVYGKLNHHLAFYQEHNRRTLQAWTREGFFLWHAVRWLVKYACSGISKPTGATTVDPWTTVGVSHGRIHTHLYIPFKIVYTNNSNSWENHRSPSDHLCATQWRREITKLVGALDTRAHALSKTSKISEPHTHTGELVRTEHPPPDPSQRLQGWQATTAKKEKQQLEPLLLQNLEGHSRLV